MPRINTKSLLIIISAIIIILISYKIYGPYTIQNFNAVNHKNINSIQEKTDSETLSFVVVGNIENSIGIFDKRILPQLRQQLHPDFILSTGNNIVGSGEGKYRVLNRTLQKMDIPFVTGVGVNEVEDEGHRNFYKYFGPFYFSFSLQNSYFIFLDTTGHSSDSWQNEWLEKQLEKSRQFKHAFVIMNKAPIKIEVDNLLEEEPGYIREANQRNYYQKLFSKYDIEAVFSSNIHLYREKEINGVKYFITGGAGGELILEDPDSFYHFLEVEVRPSEVNYQLQQLEGGISPFSKLIVNIWVAIQSFIYTNYINLLIIALIIFLGGFIFYRELTREVNYYRSFHDINLQETERRLNIAMFTNNYFPVIGGVPISIDRLARGLRQLGHEVYIFAPKYPEQPRSEEPNVIRCKLLNYFNKQGMDMPVTNIYSRELRRKFTGLNIDLVHCHHPFWMGKRGLKLGRKNKLPVVFTYHTRLEKYAHYLPDIPFLKKLFSNRLAHWLIRRFSNRCQAVFAPTETAREYLRNIGVSRFIEVLPTGVDFKNYEYSESELLDLKQQFTGKNEIMLITVSRLSREKNFYFLLEGLKKVKEQTGQPFKCLIIGDGPEKDNIKQYLKENNLEQSVELIGVVDYQKIARYYMIADLFLFASTTETQGMVLLEAMAGQTPVVAVRSSGTEDVIENGYNGFKTKEDITAWSERVLQLINNPNLRQEMADNAYKLARKHSLENMARTAEKIYLKSLANN